MFLAAGYLNKSEHQRQLHHHLEKDDEFHLRIVLLPSGVCILKQILMLIRIAAQSGDTNVPIQQRFLPGVRGAG